jgi:ATP-dependent Clp protease ATP-binding subunit ClpX
MDTAISEAIAPLRSKALDLYLATESVVGQEKARRQMAVVLDGLWQVHQGQQARSPGGVLLGGRSGTGKTMTARLMCQHLGLPYAETDATRYAEVTYKGLQLPQMFIPLLREAARMKDAEEGEAPPDDLTPSWLPKPVKGAADALFKREDIDEVVARAQTGVILLDEFDKWMLRINHVTGQKDTAMQSELLTMIEGSHEFVTATDDEVGVPFDTSQVVIICAGAFVGLYNIVRRRLHEDADPKAQQMDESFWNAITPEDFERFGLLPELAGRLSRHIFTRPLQTHHMREILTRPGGILDYYRQRYESCGVGWEVGTGGELEIVKQAMQHETGARALEFVANRMLGGEVLFEALVAERPLRVRLEPNMAKAQLVPA